MDDINEQIQQLTEELREYDIEMENVAGKLLILLGNFITVIIYHHHYHYYITFIHYYNI